MTTRSRIDKLELPLRAHAMEKRGGVVNIRLRVVVVVVGRNFIEYIPEYQYRHHHADQCAYKFGSKSFLQSAAKQRKLIETKDVGGSRKSLRHFIQSLSIYSAACQLPAPPIYNSAIGTSFL